MENLIKSFVRCFKCNSYEISETLANLQVRLQISYIEIPLWSELQKVLNEFPQKDIIKVNMEDEFGTHLNLSGKNWESANYNNFVEEISNDKPEEVDVCLDIDKNLSSMEISIYCQEKFFEWINGKNVLELFEMFNNLYVGKEFLFFKIYEECQPFYTETISFGKRDLHFNFSRLEKLELLKNFVRIDGEMELNLIPEDFHIVSEGEQNQFKNVFQKLETLISLMYLSDRFYERNEKIFMQITEMNAAQIIYDVRTPIYNQEIFKIYSWTTDSQEPSEKLEIAKNILSLNIMQNKCEDIDENAIATMKFNFALLQKKNVEHYLELKNKMAEFIVKLAEETSSAIWNMLDKLRNNVFICISSVLTIFLINIVSEAPLSNIFSDDVKRIFYVIILGSIIFMVLSIWEINRRITGIENSYYKLKDNYADILDEKDLNSVFRDDNIFIEAKERVKNRRNWTIFIWIVFIVIMILVIEL